MILTLDQRRELHLAIGNYKHVTKIVAFTNITCLERAGPQEQEPRKWNTDRKAHSYRGPNHCNGVPEGFKRSKQ